MSVESPLLISTFAVPKESSDAFLAKMCPNQCGDGNDMHCLDAISHKELKDTTRIARVEFPPASEGGAPIFECYNETGLRKWENVLKNKRHAQPLTDPKTRRLLIWDNMMWDAYDDPVWIANVKAMLQKTGIERDRAFQNLLESAPPGKNLTNFAISLHATDDLKKYAEQIMNSIIALKRTFAVADITYLHQMGMIQMSKKMFNATFKYIDSFDIGTVITLIDARMLISAASVMKEMVSIVEKTLPNTYLMDDVWKICEVLSSIPLQPQTKFISPILTHVNTLFFIMVKRVPHVFDVDLIIKAHYYYSRFSFGKVAWHKGLFKNMNEYKTTKEKAISDGLALRHNKLYDMSSERLQRMHINTIA
jgi:hypothetical protein